MATPRLLTTGLWCLTTLALVAPATAQTPPEPATIPLAITIDDLPYVGPTPHGERPSEALAAIADTLIQRDVPATGFVVCERLDSAPGALQPWLDANLAVGNHSTAHTAFDDLTVDAFSDDIVGCRDQLTAVTGVAPAFFRYPMLRTGSEVEHRDAGFAALAATGQRRAPVTIDSSEWVLAQPYAEAVRSGDEGRATAIGEAYVHHLRLAARHYREVAARRTGGRAPAQVMLLHANSLATDHLDAVLDMLVDEGFHFVTLDEALADPIFAVEDAWVDPVGASWLYRMAPADVAAWGWDRGQQRALEVRFGLRVDEATRIGGTLTVEPIPGHPAWLVTDTTDPVAANSLVVLTPGGVPVLADTPWTPAATRELLDWIELRFGLPPGLATISHFHFDAAGGIGPLVEAGIPVAISSETARLLDERSATTLVEMADLYGADYEGWDPPRAPGTSFDPAEGYAAEIGGTAVNVFYPGTGHTTDNVVTWIPELGVLFGGCLVKGGDSIGYVADGDLATYRATIERLQTLSPRVVVSGHGHRFDSGQLAHTIELAAEAEAAESEGQSERSDHPP